MPASRLLGNCAASFLRKAGLSYSCFSDSLPTSRLSLRNLVFVLAMTREPSVPEALSLPLVSNSNMTFRKWAVRVVRWAGMVAFSLVLLAFLTVQFQQRTLHWRADGCLLICTRFASTRAPGLMRSG